MGVIQNDSASNHFESCYFFEITRCKIKRQYLYEKQLVFRFLSAYHSLFIINVVKKYYFCNCKNTGSVYRPV